MKYRNPILPGFCPDPSICRVGEDYYLINSSFEFFPGVPLYHSKDLVNWEQIGHVLTRESQLPLKGVGTSGGIFAPSIRYHDGRFYMVTTNVSYGGHFFVWTDDVRGEWSDPVWIETKQFGIDPSLFWDDDGTVYFQSTYFDPETGKQCIGQCELDIETGKQVGEIKNIWSGTGGKCPEGPHLYKINGTYYLMIAEGGTEYGHMETIARSNSPWGPFESCPHNPILTHRNFSPDFSRMNDPTYVNFQGLGHADLIDDPQGNWWLIFHGFRPSQSMLHHIGRETMLAPVEWVDGWPVVNGGKDIEEEMDVPACSAKEQPDWFFTEDFTKLSALPPRWVYLRNPVKENYRLEGGLCLKAGEDTLSDLASPTFVAVRQRHFDVQATTVLDFAPTDEAAEAGVTVFHTNEHHYDLLVTKRGGKRVAILRRTVGDMQTESEPVALPDTEKITLKIEAGKLLYRFYAGSGDALTLVGEGRSQLLSTEMMLGTFTGCMIGLFAQGKPGVEAKFCKLDYVNL